MTEEQRLERLKIRRVSPLIRINILGQAGALSSDVELEVERLWQLEQERTRNRLFNGRILSASRIEPDHIAGYVLEYRRFIAQRARPELFPILRVRPVAVSGILHCADGIVFGRRAQTVTQDPGILELVPSGGLEPAERGGTWQADVGRQALAELTEETGLMPSAVEELTPICTIEDLESHVVEIGIHLKAANLTGAAILRAHQELGSAEYEGLVIVPTTRISDFLQRAHPGVAVISQALLREYKRPGRITAGGSACQ